MTMLMEDDGKQNRYLAFHKTLLKNFCKTEQNLESWTVVNNYR